MKYYLGLDNGSSSVKAALYDECGKELFVSKCETETVVPKPGWCERDMETLWEANCRVIRELIRSTGISPEQIAAVSGCGHGKGLYLWGDGKPVYPGILSSDRRALPYVEMWKMDGRADFIFDRTLQKVQPCHPVALLAWIRDNEPELISDVKYIFTCKDYIRYRLTGKAYGDVTECCGWGVMDSRTLQYDEELISSLNLSMFRNSLPEIAKPGQFCGSVTEEAAARTGLAAGTPVAAGMFDIGACAIAANAVSDKHLCMIAGTWSVNEYVRMGPVLDGSVSMNTVFDDKGHYLIEESSPTSSSNCQWYVKNILSWLPSGHNEPEGSVYHTMDEWVKETEQSVLSPVFLPFIYGGNDCPDAQAGFLGLNAMHDIRHLTRSLYEGVVFGHRWHMERLLKSHSGEVKEIHLAGGAAKSKVWVQMFADICGYPVRVCQADEPGALGCAILGAVASGGYPDLNSAILSMAHLSEPVYPREDMRDGYEIKYRLYRKTQETLNNLWKEYAGSFVS
ncbi:MAG: FGGY-family carbohydrate kinase [Candidatus Choladocola sp.]|nr:FGGY-family carbohydrate kinase [Candidatus Choladocola sp.]